MEIVSDGICNFAGGRVDGGAPGISRHSGEVNNSQVVRDNLILTLNELKTSINCAQSNLEDNQLSNWTQEANIWNDQVNITMGVGTKITAVGNSYSVTDKEGSITINGLPKPVLSLQRKLCYPRVT
ncbi:MAG: hypothetical protein R3E08_12670 [Thiotrichaceae bacterium]